MPEQIRSYRTQKDFDIARSVALKAAVDLTIAFKDLVDKNATDVALKAATRFYNWILAADQDYIHALDARDGATEPEPNWQQMVKKQIHNLQTKLGISKTDFSVPGPSGPWDDQALNLLIQQLSERHTGNGNGSKAKGGNGSKSRPGLEKLAGEQGYQDKGWSHTPVGALPISKAQFGYAVSLYRRLKVDHDPQFLNGLTSEQASEHIDELKAKL